MLWVCYWNSVTYMFGLQNSTYMHIGLRVAVDYRFNQAKVWTPNITHHSLTRNVFIYLLPFPNRIPSDISIVHKYTNLSQLQSTVFKFSNDAYCHVVQCFLAFPTIWVADHNSNSRSDIWTSLGTRSGKKKLQEAITKCRQSWMKIGASWRSLNMIPGLPYLEDVDICIHLFPT